MRWLLPVIGGGVVLVLVIAVVAAVYFSSRNNSQVVYLNGEKVGVIRLNRNNPITADEILELVVRGLREAAGTNIFTSDVVSLREARSARGEFVTVDYIISLLRESVEFRIEAAAVYVDGVWVTTLRNAAEAQEVLWQIKKQYFQDGLNIMEEESHFYEDVDVRALVTERVGFSNVPQAFISLTQIQVVDWVYTVVTGDTSSEIAQRNGMAYSELEAKNPGRDLSMIRPGDRLNMVARRPLLTVVTYELRTYTEVIPKQIQEVNAPERPFGSVRVLEQGMDGQRRVTAYIVRHNGFERPDLLQELDFEITVPMRVEVVEVGRG
jgi:LysM repeat protein